MQLKGIAFLNLTTRFSGNKYCTECLIVYHVYSSCESLPHSNGSSGVQ